ncbi:uncharacterized protein LOC143619129 [Bidens hawaiensis]|uniref:uncharacterized protein LOC143619129 n=1 Tax=Bidens hawaiensis TaxID=980011 RepID=UPI00404AF561
MATSSTIHHRLQSPQPPLPMTSSPSSFNFLRRLGVQLRRPPVPSSIRMTSFVTVRAFSSDETNEVRINGEKVVNKPPICTADELHYVSVDSSDWRLALWRYCPSPKVLICMFVYTQPEDGKLVAIGHSMGGILLYSMLSRYGYEGRDPGLAAVVTLASSLDYTSSKSSLKLLLPLVDPAQILNVPIVPLGAMLTAAYPLTSRPPYVLSWLNHMITARDMMHPDLLKKLVLNNFCTIPAKLLLQLASAFRERGLCDRSGTFFYQDHINKINVPVLAIAGDRDAICPPEAVKETAMLIPENLVTYKVFGEPDGPHYAHYDLVGGRLAVDEVYPCVIEFLSGHDQK